MQDAGAPADERGAVARIEALSPGLDPDQLDIGVLEEGGEGPDRVRAAADAGDHAGRQRSLRGERLLAGLVADHALQVADQRRIGRRADGGADHVVGGGDARDPVADRGADRLLQRPRARLDRRDLGAEQAHPLDVGRLAAHVLGAHVDDALQPEQGAGGRGRDAVLAGAGLGDHPALAHPLREQSLADGVVDLVGAGVGEVLALQVDAAAGRLGEPLGQVERRRAADEVAKEPVELGAECLVGAGLVPARGELVERRDQGLRHVAAPVGTEALLDRSFTGPRGSRWSSARPRRRRRACGGPCARARPRRR